MRDKRIRKAIVAAAGVLLIAVLLAVGRYQDRKGSIYLKNLTLQSEEEGFDTVWLKEALRQMPEQEGDKENRDTNTRKYSFAAWTQRRQESVRPESGGRECPADIIAVYGASGCVFPVGKSIPASDPAGCILGKKLSEELFGSSHAEGQNWSGRIVSGRFGGSWRNHQNCASCRQEAWQTSLSLTGSAWS